MRSLCVLVLVFVLTAQTEAANVQARLVRASLEKAATEQKLQDLEPKLRKQFGFPHYYLLGNDAAALVLDKRLRLDVGSGFVVFVTHKGALKKSDRLEVEWYSGKVSLIRTTADIDPQGTLFIKGPEVGRDWIILALTVTP